MKKSLRDFYQKFDRVDLKIIFILILLNCFGLIMIYSASAYDCAISEKYNYDGLYFFKHQLKYTVLGFVLMLATQRFVNCKLVYRSSKVIYVLCVCSIFLLFTPLAVSANNATRWIKVGPVSVQVAEFVKFGLIVGLAAFLSKNQKYLYQGKALLEAWALGVIPFLLVLFVSKNLSSAIIIAGITVTLTFIYTPWLKVHVGLGASAVAGIWLGVSYFKDHLPTPEQLSHMSFRWGRIAAWLDPEQYSNDQSFQSLQGLYAVGSGGWFGRGLGRGIQKLSNIPESQNDMIFATVCEELGLVGAAILILMFVYLIWQIVRISSRCKNLFGRILVMGIAVHISLQVIINVAVVVGVFPNTGVSLPFISYGGSAVIMTLVEIGLALSMESRHTEYRIKQMEKQ